MRRNLLKILGVLTPIVALTLNMSISSSKDSTDTDLVGLTTQSTANAECAPPKASSHPAFCDGFDECRFSSDSGRHECHY